MADKAATVYQHGTLSLLVPGLFTGTETIGTLLQHGDYGIGTLEHLDGELIIVDGEAYQASQDGLIHHLPASQTVPFATVHFDQPRSTVTVHDMHQMDVERYLLNHYPYKNVFFAVKLTGEFSHMKTRVVPKQSRPYPPLTAASKVQPIFEQNNTHGTVIGYFAPPLFSGVAVAGYHLHYLNDQHDFGGHILEYALTSGELSIQPFAALHQHFPLDNEDFLKQNFDYGSLDASINQAEH